MLTRVQTLDSSEAVVKQITDLLRRGDLKAGDKLPTEAELCRQLGVGRSSVREAKRVLAAKGVIDMQPGRGTFVRELSGEVFDGDLLLALLARETVLELQETRDLLECQIITLAIERASEEELDRLEEAVDRMERAIPGPDVYPISIEFHRGLTNATHNQVLIHLYSVIANLLLEYQTSFYIDHADAVQEVQDHREILAAVRRRDADTARALMAAHMVTARNFVLQFLD